MSDENGRIVLTRESLVPIGGAISIVLSLVGATWWLSGRLNQADNDNAERFQELRVEVRELKYRIDRSEQTSRDRWTATHQRLWAAEMRRANPTLDVPDVSDIIR